LAARILEKANAQAWAPIAIDGTLHDRASYRYFWQLLERAQHTGVAVPNEIRHFFSH
jgi:citrate lyase subunit beta/citryl-CoA lyase